jgi:hypothetical protein
MAKLFLQILGNNDVVVDSQPGTERLRGCTIEEVQENAQINEEELRENLERVDFPLIRQIQNQIQNQQEQELHFGIILTNQLNWLEQQDMPDYDWSEFISSDGFWWENVLTAWCEQQDINLFPIHLPISSEIQGGVADWEGMARLLKEKLANLIEFDNNLIQFHPEPGQHIPIDEIIIQHSSGTPATSSALYLWGIEQKLAGKNVDFVYISRQDTLPNFHSGQQWQWRFKIPQIQQLFDIQDFSGALQLLSDYPNDDFKKQVRYLDRAVSFNLQSADIDKTPQGRVIERIAIALWSERAFRERGQWMHWCLRVAGAFELAIKCLVQRQAPCWYDWQFDKRNDRNTELLYYHLSNQRQVRFKLSIKEAVSSLLINGSFCDNNNINYKLLQGIDSPEEWISFRDFYCPPPRVQGWRLSNNFSTGFLYVRNNLYHALQGDKIDKILDQKTRNLGFDHDNHPAEIAIQYLHYVVRVAGIRQPVQERINNYQNRVQYVKEQLECIYEPY